MEGTKGRVWHQLPPVVVPSPVLALAAEKDGVWAGGAGGIAWYHVQDEWESRSKGLPLTAVSAMVHIEGILLAGGTEGIARSTDGGLNWQPSDLQEGMASVTDLAISPRFSRDHTVLAATLESGILRSADSGQTWDLATFGLENFEVTALSWSTGEVVLAGTVDGIYRSPNEGRAWRLARGTDGLSVAALTFLPDGTALAALETGGLLRSLDMGATWTSIGEVPQDVQGTALLVTGEGTLLLGSAAHGILRSTDGGITWLPVHEGNALSFAAYGNALYAGTTTGVSVSANDGVTWISLPHPPIHDLREIMIIDEQPVLVGPYVGLMRYGSKHAWAVLPTVPCPLLAVVIAPDGALLASSPQGLVRSVDGGQQWQMLIEGEAGEVGHITFGADGKGWAGSSDGSRLLRTTDNGQSWENLPSPFGVLPLVALQSTPDLLMAATYDTRLYRAQLWRSLDDGETWQRGNEAETTWPIITTSALPAAFTLGASLFVQGSDGAWRQERVGKGEEPVRRLIGSVRNGERILLVLTTGSLLLSNDYGISWTKEDAGLPVDQVQDIVLENDTLYALLIGGRVWSCTL